VAAEEKLELVTDFAQLRAGMKVVLRPSACGCAHHGGMLMPLHSKQPVEDARTGGVEPASPEHFELLPLPSCAVFKHYSAMVIAPSQVAERRLYRVVDGQWDAEQAYARRTRELARR
jgi:hypothetical protein